jgi:hypothetical protein
MRSMRVVITFRACLSCWNAVRMPPHWVHEWLPRFCPLRGLNLGGHSSFLFRGRPPETPRSGGRGPRYGREPGSNVTVGSDLPAARSDPRGVNPAGAEQGLFEVTVTGRGRTRRRRWPPRLR